MGICAIFTAEREIISWQVTNKLNSSVYFYIADKLGVNIRATCRPSIKEGVAIVSPSLSYQFAVCAASFGALKYDKYAASRTDP